MENIEKRFAKIEEKEKNMTEIFTKLKKDGLIKPGHIHLLKRRFRKMDNLYEEIKNAKKEKLEKIAEKKKGFRYGKI